MAHQISPEPAGSTAPRPYLPWMLLLFAGSGCAALIYEIVWYQLLQLVIGSSAVSLAVLLATFMGGLCAGSLLLPRLKLSAQHPLRIYGKLELGIAACGILVLFCMPLVDSVYTSAVGHGMPAMLLRAVVCAFCLVPPTFLMGASLPTASRWIQTSPEGVSWLGLLYGANTVGAVAGCLIAGFYLLRVFDMATATFAAAALNVAVALASFAIAKKAPNYITPPADIAAPPAVASDAWPVYLTIGLSGATALGGEVIWTRIFGLMLGATVYTFSIILAVFLVGLGIGSTVGSIMARTARNPRALLGWSQFLLAAAIAWTAWQISDSLPYWPVNALLSTSPWYTFQIDMVRCAWGLLPATLFWGASFPLALAAAARDKGDPGQLVGRIYAANTAGAILGALTFSLLLVPVAGTASCEKILIFAAAASGLLLFLRPLRIPALAPAIAATVAAVILALNVQPVPGMLIAYGRRIMTSLGKSRILETGEGINSSIAISEWDDGAVQFHVSGKVEASTESYDMRLQRMLGHMPALMHPNPKSVLIVGFGAGVTAGSFVVHPEVQRIVICEMEPIIPPTATKYFGRQNYNVIHDPRTQVIYDDARHFVLTTPEKFDIITSDPIHPWVKGSATLYSKEYFELVRRHLNPGGVITQWVPLYESDPETVKSEIKTFFDVFPNGTIWGNDISGGGYDIVLLGQVEPAKIAVDAMQARLDRPEGARVAESLREVGFGNAVQLLATYAGQEPDLRPWLEGADINRDGSLRLQYVAGWSLNVSKEGAIYSQMLNYRRFPSELFAASPDRMQALQSVLQLR